MGTEAKFVIAAALCLMLMLMALIVTGTTNNHQRRECTVRCAEFNSPSECAMACK